MWTIMCMYMWVGIDMCMRAKKSFMCKHKSWGLVIANQVIWMHREASHTHSSVHTDTHMCINSESRDLKSCIWAFPHLLDRPIPRGQVSQWKQLWHQEPMPWEHPCLSSHHHPGTPPPSPPQPPRFQARHQSKREKPGTQLGCSWNPFYFWAILTHRMQALQQLNEQLHA